MLPMPANRKDREPEELPPVLPRRSADDRAETTSIVVNAIVGLVLLAIVATMVGSYVMLGPSSW